MHRLHLHLLSWMILPGLCGLDLKAPTQARVGQLAEWEFTIDDPAWNTNDCRKTPVLLIKSLRDGKETRRSAFLYQAHTFQPPDRLEASGPPRLGVRHTFRQGDRHEWRLMSPDLKTELATGKVMVYGGQGLHGVIRPSMRNPRLLSFFPADKEGEPFFPIGCNIAWAQGPDRLVRMQGYLARLAASGGTHFRLWCADWCGHFESAAADRYRLDQAWLLDSILAEARTLGLRLILVLDNHHDLQQSANLPYGPPGPDRLKTFFGNPLPDAYLRRLHYLVARWGADDAILAWELCNEVDLTFTGEQAKGLTDGKALVAAWTRLAATTLRELDLDRRMISNSLSDPTWKEAVFPPVAIQLLQIHAYVPPPQEAQPEQRDAIAWMSELMRSCLPANDCRPFLFGEVGWQGTESRNPGNDQDADGLLMRHLTWGGFLLGACGTGHAWWWDVYLDQRDLWRHYKPLATAAKDIDWADGELQLLAPNTGSGLRVIGWQSPIQAILWPQLRADTWYQRLVVKKDLPSYGREGPCLVLSDLKPNRTFTATGHDQAKGGTRFSMSVQSLANGRLLIPLPGDCRDLIVTVK